jgi:16S rRNA processing protein RimM
MASELFTPVGRIVKTHGLDGEVSVIPFSDASLDVLSGLEAWVVPPSASVRQTRFVSWRPGPKGPIVTLDGVDSIDVARTITGRELLVHTEALPPEWLEVSENEELLGMLVLDERHGELGRINDIILTGANDVWVVHGPLGEILIPVIDEVVLDVDVESGRALVNLLPGLLPEETDNG